MRLILLVGAGSFIGGVCRYLLSVFVQQRSGSDFPYGTLLVNLAGCFIIGCIYGVAEKTQLSTETRLLFVTGILGGFTTFSAFSAESFVLIREGHYLTSLSYILISVVAGITLTTLGAWIFKVMLR